MMTPISSAKMKFIKANPNISFLVDNRKLALEACGAMIQGKARILSMAKLITSIVSLGPKMMNFAKKYPGMFTFYARGKYLPDERKLYKYRVIRIDPAKMIYWQGYTFGKYIPEVSKTTKEAGEELNLKDESQVEGIAGLVDSADEELEMDELPRDENWLGALKSSTASGLLSDEERAVVASFGTPRAARIPAGKVAAEERDLLKKWKAARSRE